MSYCVEWVNACFQNWYCVPQKRLCGKQNKVFTKFPNLPSNCKHKIMGSRDVINLQKQRLVKLIGEYGDLLINKKKGSRTAKKDGWDAIFIKCQKVNFNFTALPSHSSTTLRDVIWPYIRQEALHEHNVGFLFFSWKKLSFQTLQQVSVINGTSNGTSINSDQLSPLNKDVIDLLKLHGLLPGVCHFLSA